MLSFSKVKLATIALVLGASCVQFGCTDREIGAGVAGAVLAAVVMDASNPQYPPPPPRRPRSYRDRGQRICHVHQEWQCARDGRCSYYEVDSCGGAIYRPMSTREQSFTLDPADLSLAYNLKPESAVLFTTSLVAAVNAQDDATARAAFAQIGLNLTSMKSMDANFQITPEMVDGMSRALQQDPKDSAMMLERITQAVRNQEASRNQGESI